MLYVRTYVVCCGGCAYARTYIRTYLCIDLAGVNVYGGLLN